MVSIHKLAALAVLSICSISAADWNPRLAADYLDSRQKDWFGWTPAKVPGGPCVSCHTSGPYLLARPALRQVLGEKQPTQYETGLLDALRARVDKRESKDVFPNHPKEPSASQAMGVESIHAALYLGTQQAFDRMWSFQDSEGAWAWFSLNLDPWEMPHSRFYGSAMAAIAIGNSGSSNRQGVTALADYLRREQAAQPLHHRLVLLWASRKLPEALKDKKPLIEDVWRKQQPDGGWTMDSLGPWKEKATAPVSTGSNSYATALTAYSLLKGGVKPSDKRMKRALAWLSSHQNSETGAWAADSMNKKFPAESMQVRFMTDAATAYASLALIEGGVR